MGASSSKLAEIYVITSANWWVYDAQKKWYIKKETSRVNMHGC